MTEISGTGPVFSCDALGWDSVDWPSASCAWAGPAQPKTSPTPNRAPSRSARLLCAGDRGILMVASSSFRRSDASEYRDGDTNGWQSVAQLQRGKVFSVGENRLPVPGLRVMTRIHHRV